MGIVNGRLLFTEDGTCPERVLFMDQREYALRFYPALFDNSYHSPINKLTFAILYLLILLQVRLTK